MSDIPTARPTETAAERATRVFVDHRELLFSMVYNMLGTVADTEDVLQETWLAWADRTGSPTGGTIEHPRAYLVRIAVNRALARQAAISRRREEYVGPWLPEPLPIPPGDGPPPAEAADAAETALRTESVSMALLVVLETLTPLERAVFVLHEVFGYPHTEIAGIVDRSPSAVRQLAHRAREHVHARRPRYQADPRVRRQVTERFLAAVVGGDLGALLEVLAPDVTLWADGGGKARAAGPHPVRGGEKIARLITASSAHRPIPDLRVRHYTVGGEPAAVLMSGDTPYMFLTLDLTPEGDRVRDIYVVTNPDKLAHLR
ncbi:RNA polymerase sigma factor SigJ [Allostreptomyces psammosilenae]|uniref:RNA polymerase sigma-70 factor (ECF subfamily) n=1 Tax=Allostreptomyces psammosilenae TaxID=1892865 RepID=A0A852ZZB8_9ACTN|nr:RNA polymerase sigma factor SigJ [Allostreptomyces psammosilenae]NYI07723.1 RNA polymerase sigma-70 factor (ECF subfamily) [Allostreptomyces psammosilenae]